MPPISSASITSRSSAHRPRRAEPPTATGRRSARSIIARTRSGCLSKSIWACDGLGLPKGLDGVVPEDLSHQVGVDFLPAQRQVDGTGEARLGVRVVRAEHEKVFAEVLRDQL